MEFQRPPPRETGSHPRDWLGGYLREMREFLSVAEQSDWFPLLVMVLSALALLWVTGRLGKARKRHEIETGQRGVVVRHGRDGATCRWFKDKVKRDGMLERWQCRTCGVDAFTHDGKAPKECKRGLREAQL